MVFGEFLSYQLSTVIYFEWSIFHPNKQVQLTLSGYLRAIVCKQSKEVKFINLMKHPKINLLRVFIREVNNKRFSLVYCEFGVFFCLIHIFLNVLIYDFC